MGKHRLALGALLAVGVFIVVFPSVINFINQYLVGVLVSISVVMGALFGPFYLMMRNKDNTDKSNKGKKTHDTKADANNGAAYLGGDWGSGGDGSGGGG